MEGSIRQDGGRPWDAQVLFPFESGLAPAAVSPVMSGDSAGHWAALVEAERAGVVVAVSQE